MHTLRVKYKIKIEVGVHTRPLAPPTKLLFYFIADVRLVLHKLYLERLAMVRITSLEKRRIRGDLIQVFRMLKGFDKVNVDRFNSGYCLQGHSMKLKVCRSHLQLVWQKFFSQQIVKLWNNLPELAADVSMVKLFKKRLDDLISDVEF